MPHYSITELRAAAESESVGFQGRTQLDAENLGYSFDQVCELIASLQDHEFRKTELYAGKIPYDVYVVRRIKNANIDELYLKVCLIPVDSDSEVRLISFHLTR